jgi:hypothetical protein
VSSEGGGASRSTDPAAGTSSATDVSLREHLTVLIDSFERRSDERFEAMKQMVDTAFSTAQTAIDKADTATEKRFEGVNEFRAQLSDQATRFVTREVMDALADKLLSQIERNRQDLDALAKRVDLREGQSIGTKVTTGVLVTIATLSIGAIGLIAVLVSWASGR